MTAPADIGRLADAIDPRIHHHRVTGVSDAVDANAQIAFEGFALAPLACLTAASDALRRILLSSEELSLVHSYKDDISQFKTHDAAVEVLIGMMEKRGMVAGVEGGKG